MQGKEKGEASKMATTSWGGCSGYFSSARVLRSFPCRILCMFWRRLVAHCPALVQPCMVLSAAGVAAGRSPVGCEFPVVFLLFVF